MKTRAIALASLNELQEIVETVEETELEQMQGILNGGFYPRRNFTKREFAL